MDTVAGWQLKTSKPLAIVLVSQHTENGRAVVRVSTESRWPERARRDRQRRITDRFLEVDRRLLATFDELVVWLHARESPEPL